MLLDYVLSTALTAAALATPLRASPVPSNSSEYEYVVVGSGAGGGSLA